MNPRTLVALLLCLAGTVAADPVGRAPDGLGRPADPHSGV